MKEYSIVVLGSTGVGKSALTVQFVQSVPMDKYDPTFEDSYRKRAVIDGHHCILSIFDTSGVERFTSMRDSYMKNGQGFILVYSVVSKSSMHELNELRDHIIRAKGTNNVALVLVGNMCDLESERKVTKEEGMLLSQRWGGKPFYETSARLKTRAEEALCETAYMSKMNVDEVFYDVVRQIISQKKCKRSKNKRKKKCLIL